VNFQTRHYPLFSTIPVLLVINAIFYVAGNLLSKESLQPLLNLNAWDIRQGEWWRLFTYMFQYQDFLHILINLWVLWMFGTILEHTIGVRRFLTLYFLSGVLAGLAWLAIQWNQPVTVLLAGNDAPAVQKTVTELQSMVATTHFQTCGYIGGDACLFSILIGTAMLFPNFRIMLLIPPVPMKLKIFAISFLLIFAFLGVSSDDPDKIGAMLARCAGASAGCIYLLLESFRSIELYPVRLRFTWLCQRLIGRSASQEQLKQELEDYDIQYAEPLYDRPAEMETPLPPPSSAEIDRLLDKVDRFGANSLTPAEKAALVRYREQMRTRIN
jgi:membrane associated rhomboid family serine protease